MTETISISDLFEEIHIDLDGELFGVRQATRSVEERHRQKYREIDEAGERIRDELKGAKPDEIEAKIVSETLDIYGDLFDIWLEPLGEKKTKAKTVVKRAFKADSIGLAHLEALAEKIGEVGQKRPT